MERARGGPAKVTHRGYGAQVIFLDTNVFVYAVGRPHPLQDEARSFLAETLTEHLVTSCEVLQELLHIYLPVRRMETLDAAYRLVESRLDEVWPLESADVHQARLLADAHPTLNARDLVLLAVCQRRGVTNLKTFDRALSAVAAREL